MRRMAACLLAAIAAALLCRLPRRRSARPQPQIAHTNLKVVDMAPDRCFFETNQGGRRQDAVHPYPPLDAGVARPSALQIP